MYLRCKRCFDVTAAACALVITAPISLLVALGVFAFLGRPILFRQTRVGFKERLFTCYKFRTMTIDRNACGTPLNHPHRQTPFGSFLRRLSLDELPQLWNILRGDISFVGPRPLYVEYLPYYTEDERRRHSVPPGLTGWAQIHGRTAIPFEERLQLDVWYVDHACWWLDFRILLRTLWIVCTQSGYVLESVPLDQLRASNGGRQSNQPAEVSEIRSAM